MDAVAAVRNAKDDPFSSDIIKIRSVVQQLYADLQNWARTEVPQHVKSATEAEETVQRLTSLSK